jgi:hypothetical protein
VDVNTDLEMKGKKRVRWVRGGGEEEGEEESARGREGMELQNVATVRRE